jgi:ribosome biogenesis protein BMS1
LKQQFDKQAVLNKSEFANEDESLRHEYEGFQVNTYVRVELTNVPCEFVTNFDPHNPVVIGGLLSNEEGLGFIQASTVDY